MGGEATWEREASWHKGVGMNEGRGWLGTPQVKEGAKRTLGETKAAEPMRGGIK